MTDAPDDEVSELASDISLPEEGMGEGMEGSEMGSETLDSGGDSLADRLLSTEPNPPLEEVESPWNPEDGGIPRIYRGIQKMGALDGGGMPAIGDILIGCLEEFHKSDLSARGSGDGESEWVIPE